MDFLPNFTCYIRRSWKFVSILLLQSQSGMLTIGLNHKHWPEFRFQPFLSLLCFRSWVPSVCFNLKWKSRDLAFTIVVTIIHHTGLKRNERIFAGMRLDAEKRLKLIEVDSECNFTVELWIFVRKKKLLIGSYCYVVLELDL